ncbi:MULTISPECIES: GNAT family N-acetyltransferase [unclassified Nocardioides]|uniref:GNAT family N-acetyltransferase n=1 Tax=unclassified Nocardioides TaxID=2615069 RepID=UPI000AC44647|nr:MULTISPECIES: GNAT family N-acetyltransferase [unclassified Nocardioides]
MEITQFGPDDRVPLQGMVDVANATIAVDAPWSHPATMTSYDGMLRNGWDGEPSVPFLATVEGLPVAHATYGTSEWDNLELAWVGVEVHPAHRRRGHGTALLEFLLDRARAEGRTSVGSDAWESEAARAFTARHGLEQKSQAINRRQVLADVDWNVVRGLHDHAGAGAADYELVRRIGFTPDDELDKLAEMTAAINDAPTDDLEIEDEVFTGERVRNYEHAQLSSGGRLRRLMVRNRTTGELAGQSVVVVESERPWIGHQHDTSVVRAHRGHRLGLVLKSAMLLWLHEVEPQLATIDTWNAESNDYMISVNEQLGYRVMGREVQYQRGL